MAEWDHRICERCWFDGTEMLRRIESTDGDNRNDWELSTTQPVGVITEGEHAGAYRMPVQANDPKDPTPPGACCFCGGMTITAIFVRHDQDTLMCQGRHGDDQIGLWSRVAAATAAS